MEVELQEVKDDIKEVKKKIDDAEKAFPVGHSLSVALHAQLAALREKEVFLLKQAAAAAQADGGSLPGATSAHAGGAAAVVSQTLESGQVFVDVLIDGPSQYQLPATLLFDTGCSMDLIISQYKAQQLGMQPDEPQVCRVISLAGDSRMMATRYKPVKVAVVMSGDDTSVPDRSAWLEAYCMADTHGAPLAGPPIQLPPGMVRTLQSADEAQAAGGSGTPAATSPTSNPVFTLRLSPVKRGRDSQVSDAILGKTGMHKLGIGMDKEGQLFAFAPDYQIMSAT